MAKYSGAILGNFGYHASGLAEQKKCRVCGEVKPIDQFYERGGSTDGRRSDCISCKKNSVRCGHLRKTMGLTLEEYKQEKASRRGYCDLCGEFSDSLVADHDHDTGKFRGFICRLENSALGTLGDNEAGILRVLEYLRKGKR